MRPTILTYVLLTTLAYFAIPAVGQDQRQTLVLENSDQLNAKTDDSGKTVWYGYGNVRLRLDSTHIQSDTVIWYKDDNSIRFISRVEAYDSAVHLWAQKVNYRDRDSLMIAEKDVVIIRPADSVKTESQRADFDRRKNIMYLTESPVLYLNYPDTANMIQITADSLTFLSDKKQGIAKHNVVIVHKNIQAECGRAEFDRSANILTMYQNPRAVRDSSAISGKLMEIRFARGKVNRIDVYDSSEATFAESADSSAGQFSGISKLYGKDISFFLENDEVKKIAAVGAARSEYVPASDDTTGAGKNIVSGDSIFIYIGARRISKVEVKGGAEGVYITKKEKSKSSKDSTADNESQIDSIATGSPGMDSINVAGPDTAAANTSDSTLRKDTMLVRPPTEDTIHYQGNFLEYFAHERIIRMTGQSKVRQGTVILTADQVDYDIPHKMVQARSVPTPSGDTTIVAPLSLKDAGDEIFGTRLVYNVDTRKGLIENATTAYEQSHYGGKDLYKEQEKVFYVDDGSLSSCDLKEPHFHFQSKKMKVIHNDRVIARPVTFYIETLPVMTIPYYVFPLKRGRHSGILPIRLGNFERGSRYIGNLGYYWAASEYWDLESALDFYENTGITINSLFRYKKLYAYSGNVKGTYAIENTEAALGSTKTKRWSLTGDHEQTLPYDIKFGASGTFVSDKNYYTNYSTNPDERLNRSMTSKANFSKNLHWGALSLSFNHTRNLDADSRSMNLPSGSFSVKSFYPFGSGQDVNGEIIKKWYNQFLVAYSNSFSLTSSKSRLTDSTTARKEFGYLNHGASINAPLNIFKYFSINPNASFTETWYDIFPTDQSDTAHIPAGIYRRGSIASGISTNTNLYGTFPVGLFGLAALRHVVTPSLSYSWSPPITKNNAVKSYTGIGSGGDRSQTLGFGLQNLFQAKVGEGEKVKKLDLLHVSSSLSYNFEAKGEKFSSLRTSLSSSLLRSVNLSGDMTHSLYDDNDKLQWRKPRLKSFSISTSFQAKGSVGDNFVRQGLDQPARDTLAGATGASPLVPSFDNGQSSENKAGSETSWNLSVSHYFSESGLSTPSMTKTHWIRFTVDVNLTANWRIKFSQNYDIVGGQTTDKTIDIYRSMHCWQGYFRWIPEGSSKGFYFRLNVSAIPDIKLEKSESGIRGALYH